jgi:hypothetical protein
VNSHLLGLRQAYQIAPLLSNMNGKAGSEILEPCPAICAQRNLALQSSSL